MTDPGVVSMSTSTTISTTDLNRGRNLHDSHVYYETRTKEKTYGWFVYYESIKRELKRRLKYEYYFIEYRCDERLKTVLLGFIIKSIK
jgi:hypothetical protein